MALKRSLGLTMLTFYGTGMILGAGIYSIIGQAAGIAGEGLWQGCGIATCLLFLFQFNLQIYLVGFIAFACSAGLYFLYASIKRRSRHETSSNAS